MSNPQKRTPPIISRKTPPEPPNKRSVLPWHIRRSNKITRLYELAADLRERAFEHNGHGDEAMLQKAEALERKANNL